MRFHILFKMCNDHYNYNFPSNVIKILMQKSNFEPVRKKQEVTEEKILNENNAIPFIIFISIEPEHVSFAETFKSL